MSQFTLYQSTDASAPVLTGENGKLVDLLDAVLINGYGSQSPAGWTKAFTGTNKAAYRQGGGNQFYMRIQDDGPGADAAREARIVGYETMSDIDNGLVRMPNPLQFVNGLTIRKSFSANSTARAWIIFADDRTIYGYFATQDGGTIYIGWGYGDFYSAFPNDPGRTFLIAGTVEANTSSQPFTTFGAFGTAVAGHYVTRDYGAVRSSVQVSKTGDGVRGSTTVMDGSLKFPHPDGFFWLSPVYLGDPVSSANSVRGILRGVWQGLYPVANVTHGDTFTALVNGEAKSFRVVSTVRGGGSVGYVVMETSDSLPTNPY